jgi:hypothetical protein
MILKNAVVYMVGTPHLQYDTNSLKISQGLEIIGFLLKFGINIMNLVRMKFWRFGDYI